VARWISDAPEAVFPVVPTTHPEMTSYQAMPVPVLSGTAASKAREVVLWIYIYS
jgi:hypothetical protein